jgi:predicted ATPase
VTESPREEPRRDREVILTPDQRVRVFISSTLEELAAERAAARRAIRRLRMAPVWYESGARPHPPRRIYRAYLEQSQVFVGIYWQRYGWVAPGMDISGLEDEYRLAAGKAMLLYLKRPAPDQEPRMTAFLDRIREAGTVSYRTFATPRELERLLAEDLAVLLSESFYDAALLRDDPSLAVPGTVRDAQRNQLNVVDETELDMARFERLVSAGRRALSSGDMARARADLTDALGCWRDPAPSDVADPAWAQGEVRRLEELKEVALESLLEARLALGEAEEVVVTAEQAVAEHPYRERLWAHLILGLYRSGRQSDALSAYQRVRQLLADELGLEPSKELTALERAILARDPALIPVAPRTSPARPRPRRHNLPVPLSTFIGRDQETAEVEQLLCRRRLVTVTGVGGTGKTRLALHVAAKMAEGTKDGIWFVDLAPVKDPELVPVLFAEALGLRPNTDLSLADAIAQFIEDQEMLVVVDNCEHLIDATAVLVQKLLATGSKLKILATSRERLRLPGEALWTLQPLAVPVPGCEPEEALACDSVRLFADRAAAVQPGFALDTDALVSVAQIVTRLDGLPLAIELAAARVGPLRPKDIVARLDDRFVFLAGGQRAALPRQQALAATLEWSYELLGPPEQAVFRRISVFADSFSLNAACAVSASGELASHQVPEVIWDLVCKSLLTAVDEDPDVPRYRLLPTVREYAAALLSGAGDTASAVAAHRGYYHQFATEAKAELTGPAQGRCLASLRLDHDNLRMAITTPAVSGPDRRKAAELFAALGRYWFIHGQPTESMAFATTLLEVIDPEQDDALRARVLLAAAWASVYQVPATAMQWCQDAITAAQRIGDDVAKAEATSVLAGASYFHGDPDPAVGEEALALARAIGNPVITGLALLCGGLTMWDHDRERWKKLHEEAASVTEASGDDLIRYMVMMNLGELHYYRNDLGLAREYYETGISIAGKIGYQDPMILASFGRLLAQEGEHAVAMEYLLAALDIGRRYSTYQTLYPLYLLAHSAMANGDDRKVTMLFGYADKAAADSGISAPDLTELIQEDLAHLRLRMGDGLQDIYQRGASLTLEDAITVARELSAPQLPLRTHH